jgi:N-acetyl-1-D-myo-inositol-2-amino-2-deoxy-alpha-D-glucopyranoside deacetylase
VDRGRPDGLTLLCVHPHPDDEAIACGGVLARYGDEGVATYVVTCTGGEAGENLAGIDLGAHDLVWHRRREMADAVAALGLTGHTWLGYRDSGMAGTDDNHRPDAFAAADLYEAGARLARVIRELRPDVVVSDDEHGTYGHPDHVRAHRVTERAVAMAADPWWETGQAPWTVAKRYVHTLSRGRMWRLHTLLTSQGLASPFGDEEEYAGPDDLPMGSPDELVTTRVDVSAWLGRKQEAMRAHRSQIAEDSFFFNVPDDMIEQGFGVEEFVRLAGPS